MNPTDYLKNVPQENYFRLADGRIIKNLEELQSIVNDSGDKVFYDHVTPDRNDFASWIRECVKNPELYNGLMPIKDKQSFLDVLGRSIELFKNPKISETMKFFSEDYDPGKERQSSNTQDAPPVNQLIQSDAQLISPQSTQQMSDDAALDFEQVLGPIIQEIQEEIFFWQ